MAPKSKTRKKTAEDKMPSKEPSSELSIEYYRTQIQELEYRVKKYQHKCEELELREKDFSFRYTDLEMEKKDIVHYLKRSLAKKEDEVTDIANQLLELQQAKEAEKEVFDRQFSQLRQEFQDKKDQLTSENMLLAGKLAALEEFQVQKEHLMARLAALEEQLVNQSQEHQTEIYNLEKKAVVDNDRLKKEMKQHLSTVAAEFHQASEKKMPQTTLRAIRENMLLTEQLQKISGQVKELLEENKGLKEKECHLKQELDVVESLVQEATRKSVSSKKVIQQLTEKLKQQQIEHEGLKSNHQDHIQLQEHTVLKNSSLRNHSEVERLKKQFDQQRVLKDKLQTILQEAIMMLKEEPKKVPNQKDSEPTYSHSHMMKKLLALLEKGTTVPQVQGRPGHRKKLLTQSMKESN